MKQRKVFHLMSAGAAVLGVALCVPAALLAQTTDQPQDSPAATAPQSGAPDAMHSGEMHHQHSPQKRLQHMTRTLNLTPEQQQQILPILQDVHSQMEALHNNTSLTPQQRHEQMHSLMQSTRPKIEALLTDTQKQQWHQEMQQHREKMHEHGMGQGTGDNAPPPAAAVPAPPQQ